MWISPLAKLIVPEIPNGACLQLGIGGMPNTVGQMIGESDLKDPGPYGDVRGCANGSDPSWADQRPQEEHQPRQQTYAFGAGTRSSTIFWMTIRNACAPGELCR